MSVKEINFMNEFSKYKEDIIKHTINLVKIPSTLVDNEIVDGVCYRFGYQNKLALDYYLDLAEELGFKTKNIENVCGEVVYDFGAPEDSEIFACLCHLDVVPADGEWKNPPYEPWIEDGKIYGRGTSDDKGPAVVSLYALKVLKDLNIKVSRKIKLIVGTDEESGSRGLHRYMELEKNPDLGISPDADFPIIFAEKGITSFEISGKNESGIKAEGGVRLNVVAPWAKFTSDIDLPDFVEKTSGKIIDGEYYIEGKSAHAMEPNNGVNAIKEFVKYIHDKVSDNFINFIYEKLMNTRLKDMGLDITDVEMGDLTMNIGLLKMDKESKLGINMRYPRNLDFNKFYESFNSQAKEYGLEVKVLSNTKPHYIDPKSDFIAKLHKSYIKYTNDYSPLKTIGGGTYAREIKNGVAFGVKFPNEEEMAHEVNEYIKIDSLMKAGVIITDAIYNINKQ